MIPRKLIETNVEVEDNEVQVHQEPSKSDNVVKISINKPFWEESFHLTAAGLIDLRYYLGVINFVTPLVYQIIQRQSKF